MEQQLRIMQRKQVHLNNLLVNLKLSILLTFITLLFIFSFGLIVAIVNNYSTQILKWTFSILMPASIIVFVCTLISQILGDFTQRNPKRKREAKI